MRAEIHKLASIEYFDTAKSFDAKLLTEQNQDKKTALMVVAAQNYFYSVVNAIEYTLAKEKKEHSFSHENRFRKIKENYQLFPEAFRVLYDKVDRDYRNKVAYRGENSEKYKAIKELAEMATKLL